MTAQAPGEGEAVKLTGFAVTQLAEAARLAYNALKHAQLQDAGWSGHRDGCAGLVSGAECDCGYDEAWAAEFQS